MQRNLSRPFTILIFAQFFSRLRRGKKFGGYFFPPCAAAACTTVILFFSVVQSNLCRFFSFRDMQKKIERRVHGKFFRLIL